MFFWNKTSVRWYQEAADYGSFHQQLANLISPYIQPTDTILDMGCGLGYLDVAIAPLAKQVIGTDISPLAIQFMQQQITAKNITNLQAIEADYQQLPPMPKPNTLIMSFFCNITQPDKLEYCLNLCQKQLIYICCSHSSSKISPSGQSAAKKLRTEDLVAFFKKQQLQFKLIQTEIEFGQPLNDIADAEAFIAHYDQNTTSQTIVAHLEKTLQQQANGKLYLPNLKKIGIFIIEKPINTATD